MPEESDKDKCRIRRILEYALPINILACAGVENQATEKKCRITCKSNTLMQICCTRIVVQASVIRNDGTSVGLADQVNGEQI